jgi:hypothetical protein
LVEGRVCWIRRAGEWLSFCWTDNGRPSADVSRGQISKTKVRLRRGTQSGEGGKKGTAPRVGGPFACACVVSPVSLVLRCWCCVLLSCPLLSSVLWPSSANGAAAAAAAEHRKRDQTRRRAHAHTYTHRSTIPTLTVHRAPRACALFRLPQWPSPFRCALTRRAARPQGPEAPAMPLRTECKLQGKHTQREKHTGPNLECTRPGWNRSRCPSLRVRLVHRSPLVRLPVLRFSFFVVW